MKMEQQLQERLTKNISAFDDLVKSATAYKAQSDTLRKLTGPMGQLVGNIVDGDEATTLAEQLANIDQALPGTIANYLAGTRELLSQLGAQAPDRTAGDQAAKALTDTVNAFKGLGVDLPETEQIGKLVEAWSASRPASVSTGTRTRRDKGEGTEITAHCTHPQCTWNNIDRTNPNSLRWSATKHWLTHHNGQERPAKDSGSQKGREVWVSMTDALNLLTAGGNGQTSADAPKAEFRFDLGDTTTK